MSTKAAAVVESALALSEEERASVVDQLLESLNKSDPRLEALWLAEAHDRLDAYERGELEAIPAEEVFKRLRNRHQ